MPKLDEKLSSAKPDDTTAFGALPFPSTGCPNLGELEDGRTDFIVRRAFVTPHARPSEGSFALTTTVCGPGARMWIGFNDLSGALASAVRESRGWSRLLNAEGRSWPFAVQSARRDQGMRSRWRRAVRSDVFRKSPALEAAWNGALQAGNARCRMDSGPWGCLPADPLSVRFAGERKSEIDGTQCRDESFPAPLASQHRQAANSSDSKANPPGKPRRTRTQRAVCANHPSAAPRYLQAAFAASAIVRPGVRLQT